MGKRINCRLEGWHFLAFLAMPIVAVSVFSTWNSRSRGFECGDAPLPENFTNVCNGVYTGSEPQGLVAFGALAELGVQTVVSVDGSPPDIEGCGAHGMRYVHIAFGYDGVPLGAQRSLARVLESAEAPFYIHCHHGRHRGPAAAAIVALIKGDFEHDDAEALLTRAGTSRDYAGLWRDVREFSIERLGSKPFPALVEVAQRVPLVESMAAIDRLFDQLQLDAKGEWAEASASLENAVVLREEVRESRRLLDGSDEYPDGFYDAFEESEKLALTLEAHLRSSEFLEATVSLKALKKNCVQCHRNYRD